MKHSAIDRDRDGGTHGSFLIRQHGHPGVALPLVISNSAIH